MKMSIEQVMAVMSEIIEEKGNINDAIDFDLRKAYTSDYWGFQPARLVIHVEDFTGFNKDGEEQFQDYSEETIDATEEWLNAHGKYCERWSGGEWEFDDFRVILEYSCEDI